MASSQYNSVYDMFKGNASKTGNAPDPNEPDPNAPIYSMYGNNQFGSPVLPDQKPNFNSVYDIYGQGKMNDWSGGAVKTPKSPLDKPNQNPTIGNPARPPVVSNPFVPEGPSAPEDSEIEDDPYTPGSSSGGGGSVIGGAPTPPGEPPPLDKQPDPAAPPAPPGGSGGGSGGGGSGGGGKKGSGSGSGDGGGGNNATNNPPDPGPPRGGAVRGPQAPPPPPPPGGSGDGNTFDFQGPAGSGGEPPPEIGGAPTDSPMTKEEALANGYLDPVNGVSPEPLYTEWDGEKMIIHWSDGYSEPSEAFGGKGRQFKDKATSPVDSSPGTNYDGDAGDDDSSGGYDGEMKKVLF